MKIKSLTLLLSGAVLLAACAATPEKTVSRETRLSNVHSTLSNRPTVADEKKGHVRVYAGYERDYSPPSKDDEYPAQYLRVVNPADNSKMLAAKVASALFQSNASLGYSKYQLKGKRTDIANQSIQAAFNPVRDYIFQQFAPQVSGEAFPFTIMAGRFYLIYDSYAGNKEETRPYELVQIITFRKIREDVGETDKDFKQFTFTCTQNGVKHTMPEWQANNHRLLHATAKQYAQNCANELLTKHKADLHAAYIR